MAGEARRTVRHFDCACEGHPEHKQQRPQAAAGGKHVVEVAVLA